MSGDEVEKTKSSGDLNVSELKGEELDSTPIEWLVRARKTLHLPPLKLSGTSTTSLETGSEQGVKKEEKDVSRKQKAINEYGSLRNKVDEALQPVKNSTSKTLPGLQVELKSANDSYLGKIEAATDEEAENLVKAVADKLPGVSDLRRQEQEEVDAKEKVEEKYLKGVGKEVALIPLKRPEPEAIVSLRAANQLVIENLSKASAKELDQLVQNVIDKMPAAREAVRKRDAIEDYQFRVRPALDRALNLKPDGSKKLEQLQETLRKVNKTFETSIDGADADGAEVLVANIDKELKLVDAASSDRLLRLYGDDKQKKSDVRAKALEYLKDDPSVLKSLAQEPEGRKFLDELVGDVGSKASSKDSKTFITEALKARYGLEELKGDLTTKALPRLYNVLGMVPESHTFSNEKLREFKRNKNYKPMSWYHASGDADEGVGKNSVVLNGVRTGGFKGWVVDTIAGNLPTSKYRNVKDNDKSMNAFNATTLHEIAHAVDEKQSFMKRQGNSRSFGAWQVHSIEEVADIAGNLKGFYQDFATVDRNFLRTYLVQALDQGFDPSKLKKQSESTKGVTANDLLDDPGVKKAESFRAQFEMMNTWNTKETSKAIKESTQAIACKGSLKSLAEQVVKKVLGDREPKDVVNELLALAAPDDLDWKKVAEHPAVKWCQMIKLKSPNSGLWEQGDKASKLAIEGRVYEESYSDDWHSFDASALAQRITNYQFRAPGEWFAEAYSAFYMGKLPDSHPLADWLEKQGPPAKK